MIDIYERSFPGTSKSLANSMYSASMTLLFCAKLILFTVHNHLTKRDYTYSIDDLFDLGVAVLVIVWI